MTDLDAELAALAEADAGQRAASLAALERIEQHLAKIIANPGPATAGGEIVRDARGEPVPDARVIAEARRVMGLAAAARERLAQ